jgi:hypothetical protein
VTRTLEVFGWKHPVDIAPAGKLEVLAGTYRGESINPNASALTKDFCAIGDYRDFEGFIRKYGIIMLEPYLHDLDLPTPPYTDSIPAPILRRWWQRLEPVIKNGQGNLQDLMRAKVSGQKKFEGLLKPYLERGVPIAVMDGNIVREAVHFKYIEEACALQIARTKNEIVPCARPKCDRLFIKIEKGPKAGKYCSSRCKSKAPIETDPVGKKRAALIQRVIRRNLPDEVRTAVLGELRDRLSFETIEGLEKLETKYGLEVRHRWPTLETEQGWTLPSKSEPEGGRVLKEQPVKAKTNKKPTGKKGMK